MENIMSLANSTIMWVFALLIIAVAVLQSVVLYRMARKYVNQTGVLTNEEIKVCMRSGGIVAVGPAVSVFVVALSMISMLGAPFTLMRVGMIGSASTELTAASIGAEAAGVTLGVDTLTGAEFTASLWCCAVMSAGYLIFVPFVTRGIGKALNKVIVPEEGKKRSVLSWLISSLLPFVIFLALSYIQAKKSLPHTISLIFAAILMLGINIAAEKSGKKWLRQWAMAFSVLGGIVIGALSNALL
ncbi:MAG: DUF5058 family protein [Lachnospiraceae bacterium]|nr:DUF5058 family protein [Lachnospiraceae bacterium]